MVIMDIGDSVALALTGGSVWKALPFGHDGEARSSRAIRLKGHHRFIGIDGPDRKRQSQKLCRKTSFLKATTSSCKAETSEDWMCIFSSSRLHRCWSWSIKAFCRFRHFVAAFRLSSSSRACLSERGVMRPVVDFFRLAGVFLGRYESSFRSIAAMDIRRRSCCLFEREELVVESIEPVLTGKDTGLVVGEDETSSPCGCRSCGWTNSGIGRCEASLGELGCGDLENISESSMANSRLLFGKNETLSWR